MGLRGMHKGFWWESQMERDHEEDIDGRTILKWILDGMYWIDLYQGTYQCRALVNAAMNLRVP
jgi:hypothetical protein